MISIYEIYEDNQRKGKRIAPIPNYHHTKMFENQSFESQNV